jgi:hypothetical protein
MKKMSLLFFVLVLILPVHLLAAPQLLTYEEPLQFSWPPTCAPFEDFTFLLYSKDGAVKDLRVVVKEIKTPTGGTLPSGACQVAKDNTEVTPEGTRISLHLTKSFFLHPGDYKISLMFDGKPTEVQPLIKNLTIHQPPAEINLEELKDCTLKLKRSRPWCAASGNFQLLLYETTRKVAIQNPVAHGQEIFQEKTKILAPGEVSVPATHTNCLAMGAQWPVHLNLSGLEQTGSFNTSLRVDSPSFDKSIRIPLNIQVTDRWGFPLAVILFGVVGAFIVRWLSKKFRPRQENNYRIIRLEELSTV